MEDFRTVEGRARAELEEKRSRFIASLAFGSVDPELINWAKLGILVGSISSAVIGYSWLRVRLRPSV